MSTHARTTLTAIPLASPLALSKHVVANFITWSRANEFSFSGASKPYVGTSSTSRVRRPVNTRHTLSFCTGLHSACARMETPPGASLAKACNASRMLSRSLEFVSPSLSTKSEIESPTVSRTSLAEMNSAYALAADASVTAAAHVTLATLSLNNRSPSVLHSA